MFRKELFDLYKKLSMPSNEISAEIAMIYDYCGINALKEIKDGLTKQEEDSVRELVYKRIQTGMPLQYLLGFGYFMGEKYYVDENTLIPRPETEILVREAAKLINSDCTVLDIGTGTGCIAIGLAKLTKAKIDAVDISLNALKIAEKNAKLHKVNCNFFYSDLFSNIKRKYDMIISNPPYIPMKDISKTENHVKNFEPHAALFTNDEIGVEFYEKITEKSVTFLNKNGYLCFEAGCNQADIISKIFQRKGFTNIEIKKDFDNIERVIIAKYF